MNHSGYHGKKFEKWNKSGTKALAIVGKLKTSREWATQSILIPKLSIRKIKIEKIPTTDKKILRQIFNKTERNYEIASEEQIEMAHIISVYLEYLGEDKEVADKYIEKVIKKKKAGYYKKFGINI